MNKKLPFTITLKNTNVKQTVIILCIPCQSKTNSITGNITHKNKTFTIKNFNPVCLNLHYWKLMTPESLEYRPKIIQMSYMTLALFANLMNYITVPPETRYRSEHPAVDSAKIKPAEIVALKCLDHLFRRPPESKLISQKILRTARNYHQTLIITAVSDYRSYFTNCTVTTRRRYHRAIIIFTMTKRKLRRMIKRIGIIHLNFKSLISKIVSKTIDNSPAYTSARLRIDYICYVTVIRCHTTILTSLSLITITLRGSLPSSALNTFSLPSAFSRISDSLISTLTIILSLILPLI